MRNLYSRLLLLCVFALTTTSYGQNQKDIIKAYMSDHLATLNLSITDADHFTVTSYGTLSNPEFQIAYLQQEINGVKIANTAATVVLKNNVVTSFNHTFIKNIFNQVNLTKPSITALQAANYAVSNLDLNNVKNVKVVNFVTKQDVTPANLKTANFEAPLNYTKNKSGSYILTYEVIVKDPSLHWWQTKINASNGNIEQKLDLMITCNFDAVKDTDANPANHNKHTHTYKQDNLSFNVEKATKNHFLFKTDDKAMVAPIDGSTYNAYPLRVETPNHGDRTMITNPAAIATQPAAKVVPSPNGWQDFTAVAQTKTVGNNVQAYEDATNINGPASDNSFAQATSPGTFDYPLDLTKFPKDYQRAVIVNLFVWNNYMHDVFYHYGFDEINGNFQEGSYNRFKGPEASGANNWDGDEVQAEAQDGSGLNNANFGTLVDGFEPTMQMFLWGASPFGDFLDIVPPSAATIQRSYASSRFPFKSIPREEDPAVQGLLVLAQDDGLPYTGQEDGGTAGPSPATDDGCTAYTTANALAVKGKIVIVRRGVCTFSKKITLAQQNGAIGVIIVNNAAGAGPANGGGTQYVPITIPSISISLEDGDILIKKMATESVFGRLIDRGPLANLVNRDGDIDQGIIAHEYGHGISTRLVGGRNRIDCLLSQAYEEQMGEGWSDFFGLVMTQKIGDTPTQKRGIGTYVQFQNTEGPGIRPSPYSTDFAINNYTYAAIANPALTVPHGIGFVWATMIWDMYWAFIGEYGFDADIYYGKGGNNKAMQLIMDGLKLITCGNVGFVEGRDAIIRADKAIYAGKNECLIRKVFARRGVGALALQGTAERRNDQTENFTVNPPLGACTTLSVIDQDKTLFSVFPNPANTEVFISTNKNTGKAGVTIFDLNGRKLIDNSIELTNTAKVNVGTLSSGIYIININTEDGEIYTQKLIKK